MLLFYVIPIVAVYVFIRVVYPITRGWIRILLLLLLVCATAFPPFVQFFGGGISSPTLNREAMIFGDSLFVMLVTAGIVFGVRDFVNVLSLAFCRKDFARMKRLTALLSVFVVIYSGYGVTNALKEPVIVDVVAQSSDLPDSFDGFTIVQISDVHVANVFGKERVETIVGKANGCRPDLIVLTGDLVDGKVSVRQNALLPLARLNARHGVYGVEGNHEYYVDYDGWKRFYESLGIRFLYNESVEIDNARDTISLVGVSDWTSKRFHLPNPDVKRAVSRADSTFKVALVHQPKYAQSYAEEGVNLLLCGHTHGGQSPFWSLVVALFNNRFVKGRYDLTSRDGHPMILYVNSGTGLWTGFLMRVSTQNEITRITLKKVK